MRRVVILAALALLVAAAARARISLEPEALAYGRIRDPAWLPSGGMVRLASFGQRLLLADVYWLKTVMYVGEGSLAPDRGWEALYPLGEIVTDLDPRFGYAYQVVGSNLSGLAHRYDLSDRILEKGMRNVPDRWSLPFVYAVNKFFYEEDFATAAEYARRAAVIGKRPHLALLAANLSLVANTEDQYRIAASFLEESIRQADNPDLKGQLEARLVKVRTYEVLSRVERAIALFRDGRRRLPETLGELVAAGLLPGTPGDPGGGVVQYDPATGAVASSKLGPRRPLRVTR